MRSTISAVKQLPGQADLCHQIMAPQYAFRPKHSQVTTYQSFDHTGVLIKLLAICKTYDIRNEKIE
jgi:hypothetical protein